MLTNGAAAEARQAVSLADAAMTAGAGYLVYASAAGALQARSVPKLDSLLAAVNPVRRPAA